jgi:chemotaxis protein MotB
MSGHAKKKKGHEEENSERWLLTYADMITLLVAFFMMMYSMSVINLEKFKKAAIGIRSGFNGLKLPDKSDGESIIEKGSKPDIAPPSAQLVELPQRENLVALRNRQAVAAAARVRQQERSLRIQALSKKLEERMNANTTSSAKIMKIVTTSKGVAIEMIGDLIFFPLGSSQLSDEAKKILRSMVALLSDMPNEISVEGHTSANKTQGAAFIDNWELSTQRATTVVKFLLNSGTIDPKRICVTGYGEYRPLVKEEDGKPTTHNDRVRVFIYQE